VILLPVILPLEHKSGDRAFSVAHTKHAFWFLWDFASGKEHCIANPVVTHFDDGGNIKSIVFRIIIIVIIINITGCMVAQRCCEGEEPFQWENPKFDPLYTPTS